MEVIVRDGAARLTRQAEVGIGLVRMGGVVAQGDADVGGAPIVGEAGGPRLAVIEEAAVAARRQVAGGRAHAAVEAEVAPVGRLGAVLGQRAALGQAHADVVREDPDYCVWYSRKDHNGNISTLSASLWGGDSSSDEPLLDQARGESWRNWTSEDTVAGVPVLLTSVRRSGKNRELIKAMDLAASLRPDTVYLLWDGDMRYSEKVRLDVMTHLTRPQPWNFAIHTFGMGITSLDAEYNLTAIAQAHSGTYRRVDVPQARSR